MWHQQEPCELAGGSGNGKGGVQQGGQRGNRDPAGLPALALGEDAAHPAQIAAQVLQVSHYPSRLPALVLTLARSLADVSSIHVFEFGLPCAAGSSGISLADVLCRAKEKWIQATAAEVLRRLGRPMVAEAPEENTLLDQLVMVVASPRTKELLADYAEHNKVGRSAGAVGTISVRSQCHSDSLASALASCPLTSPNRGW